MSVALRTITRLQDADDINVSLGAGVDEYALCWDNDTAKFVLRQVAGVYLLATGATTGATSQAQAFTNGVVTGAIKPSVDSTTALQLQKANGTAVVTVDTTNSRVGIGTSAPVAPFHLREAGKDLGITSAMISQAVHADIVAEGEDARLVLFSQNEGSHGSTVVLAEVNTGVYQNQWAIGRASSGSGSALYVYYGTNPDYSLNTRLLEISTVGEVGLRRAPKTNTALTIETVPVGGAQDIITYDAGTGHAWGMNIGTSFLFSSATSFDGTYTERVRFTQDGKVGIGTTAPGSLLHGLLTSAATNAVTNVLTIGHDTSGTAAAGFGAGQLFALESSTTAAQSAARIQALWYEATHATRKADLVLTAYDTAEREGLRIRGAGSAPAIGFLGATPQARIAHVADPAGGATVDAEARSAINSILATLENFGFHATS